MKLSRSALPLVAIVVFGLACSQQAGRVPTSSADSSADGSGSTGSGSTGASVAGSSSEATGAEAATLAAGPEAPDTGAAAAVVGGETSPPAAEPLSVACRSKYDELRRLRARIPLVFAGLDRSHEEIDRDIQKAITLAEEFLAECGSSAEALWVRSYLARDMFTRISRVKADFIATYKRELGLDPKARVSAEQAREFETRANDELEAYRERIDGLATEALTKGQPGSDTACNALALQSDIAFHHAYDFERSRTYARRFLEECEGIIEGGQDYWFNIGLAYLYEGRWEDARAHIREAIEKRKDREAYPTYNDVLFQSLWALGDLGGVEELMARIPTEYRQRLDASQDISRLYRMQFEQWMYTADFYCALARYALGDIPGAVEKLRSYADRVGELEVELAQREAKLPQVLSITRDFRSNDLLEFLTGPMSREPTTYEFADGFQGKVPKHDFEGNVRWVSGKPVSLAGAKGKVVAIVFRQPRHARSLPFLREVERIQAERPDAFLAVNLSFMPGAIREESREIRIQRMAEEVEELGLTVSSGFDVSPSNDFYKACHATLGSGSFVMLDTEGRLAWYHVDPTARDLNVVRTVAERLMPAKPIGDEPKSE